MENQKTAPNQHPLVDDETKEAPQRRLPRLSRRGFLRLSAGAAGVAVVGAIDAKIGASSLKTKKPEATPSKFAHSRATATPDVNLISPVRADSTPEADVPKQSVELNPEPIKIEVLEGKERENMLRQADDLIAEFFPPESVQKIKDVGLYERSKFTVHRTDLVSGPEVDFYAPNAWGVKESRGHFQQEESSDIREFNFHTPMKGQDSLADFMEEVNMLVAGNDNAEGRRGAASLEFIDGVAPLNSEEGDMQESPDQLLTNDDMVSSDKPGGNEETQYVHAFLPEGRKAIYDPMTKVHYNVIRIITLDTRGRMKITRKLMPVNLSPETQVA